MPVELSFPLVILVMGGIIWFVGSHADVPANKKQKIKDDDQSEEHFC